MYKLISLIIAVLIVYKSWRGLRARNISKWFFLLTVTVGVSVVISSFFPDLSTVFARLIGIQRGVDFAFFVGMLFLLHLNIILYMKSQQNKRDITRLVRELALRDIDSSKKKE